MELQFEWTQKHLKNVREFCPEHISALPTDLILERWMCF